MVSQKCQYALRAILELAKRRSEGAVKIHEIAEAQAIPPRFLEVILSQLKRGGFVESRRGNEGGYLLIRSPRRLTIGQVIRFIEGPLGPVGCISSGAHEDCPLRGECAFMPMWERARDAISAVYDGTTFDRLLEEDRRMRRTYVPSYAI